MLNDEKIYDKFINDIEKAKQELSLVCFIGAGVSIHQGYPNWDQYVNDLIHYWKYHLDELTDLEDTTAIEVESVDRHILRHLELKTMSKKRKIDMVQFLIKKYSNCSDESKTQKVYDENILKCENTIFRKTKPFIPNNEILDELVKMNPSFMTTNYDNEIQKSIKRRNQKELNVIENINLIEGSLTTNSIIHLHGVPDGDPKYFINSAISYMNIYNGDNVYKNKIVKLFKGKDNPVVLFVGCSMEEDEVLSILGIDNDEISFYTLMKKEKINEYTLEKKFNQFVSSYYKARNVQFIWYGEEYDDLSPFIRNNIVKDLDELTDSTTSPDDLRKVMLGDE